MKKLLLFAVSLAIFTLAGAENLLKAADLKIVPGSVMPKGWFASPNANAQVIKLANGKRAFELTTSTDGKISHVRTYIKLTPGQTYKVSCTVQGDPGVKGRFYMECAGKTWQTFMHPALTGSGKPQKCSLVVKFKPAEKIPFMVLRLDSPGKMVFSDFRIEKYEVPLVKNANFDGLKHWRHNNKAAISVVKDPQKGNVLLVKSLNTPRVYAIQYRIPLKAGVTYLCTVDVKGRPGDVAFVYVEKNKTWESCRSKLTKCNGKWQTLKFEVKFDKLPTLPYLVLRTHNANGQILFANPRITVAPGKFQNGDFEKKNDSWQLNKAKIIDSKSAQKNVLQLQNFSGKASAVQSGIAVKRNQAYRISYKVRGGTDRRYTDSQNATWFRVAARMNGKLIAGTDHWQDVFTSWHTKSVTFCPPRTGHIDIVCELRNPGTVWFDNIEFAKVSGIVSPVEIVLGLPYGYRETIIAGSTAPITGNVICNISGVTRRSVSFNGKTVNLPGKKFSFPVPQKTGKYPLTVTVFDKKGKALAKDSITLTLRKPESRKITFTKDRVMMIDDKPFFPIGVWGISGKKSFSEKMRIVAETGFNCARVRGEEIDDAADHGLLAFVRVSESVPVFRSRKQRQNWINNYRLGLEEIKDHPSLIGYCNSDEPAWRGKAPGPIIESYNIIRSIDPDRPIYLNEAPRGRVEDLRIYTEASDVYGVDIYPVPAPNPHSELDDKNLTSVGKYTDICRAVVRDTQPVWMTLQAFAWGALKKQKRIYPTHEQNRFMAYNAIAHGATGLFYWGFNQGHEKWDLFKTLGITIKEIRSMTSVLVSPTVKPATIKADKKDINIMQKKVNGKNYYIVLNEGPKNHKVKFSGKLPAKLYVLTEKRSVTPAAGTFTDDFKPYSVHVYSETEQTPAPLPDFSTRRMKKKVDLGSFYKKANWIWYPGRYKTNDHKAVFYREFTLDEMPVKAEVFATADDHFRLWFNGKLQIEHFDNQRLHTTVSFADVTKLLKKGKNILSIKALDGGVAPCAMLFALRLVMADGREQFIVSDADTLSAEKIPAVWPPANAKGWVKSQVIGRYGINPWGDRSLPQEAAPRFSDAFPF